MDHQKIRNTFLWRKDSTNFSLIQEKLATFVTFFMYK